MSRRSEELRRRHRRILLGSFVVAVLLHVAAFVFLPGWRARPAFAPDGEGGGAEGPTAIPLYVEVVFGPPIIVDASGRRTQEERSLEAEHVLALPRDCEIGRSGEGLPRGSVGLRVWQSGRTDVTAPAEGTGSDCGDAVITAVADALRYHWLPNERFPAPVDLVQPVTLVRSGGPGATGEEK